jgi:predicted PurR-regulated permease PerM
LFFILIIIYIWPYINQQITEFSSTPKEKIEEIQNKTLDILNFFNITSITREQLKQSLVFYSKQVLKLFTDNIILTLSSITQIASYFIIAPFLLFYLLKDDYKIKEIILNLVSKKYKNEIKKISNDIDLTLSYFIGSQVLVALIVGLLIFMGYWGIGLNYVFVLSFLAFIFNIIPFTGPFISTVPALLIGLAESPSMGLKVIAVVLAVHLLDLNLISPRIVGQKLNIHPVTIIFLLVVTFPLLGLVGLFLITPLYAVLKIVAYDLYDIKTEEKITAEEQ